MNPYKRRPRKRARAVQQTSAVGLDWCALAVAIWLACLVGGQLILRMPDLPAPRQTLDGGSSVDSVPAY